MKNTAQIADAVLGEIRENDGVLLCVLFGSAARDRMTESSDVDLAVAGAGIFSADHLADLQVLLSRVIGREIDILDLHRLEGLILKKGAVFRRGLPSPHQKNSERKSGEIRHGGQRPLIIRRVPLTEKIT